MFPGQEGKILHAELHINADCILYFNDTGDAINILLQMESEEEINTVYSGLKVKGNVVFALQKNILGLLSRCAHRALRYCLVIGLFRRKQIHVKPS